MTPDGGEHELPIETVEEGADVEVEHPVVAPATLTRRRHGRDGRLARPVAVGIGVEHRLQDRLQIATGDLLGDTVGDGGNAEHSLAAAISLRNGNLPHGRRKIAP